MNQDREKYLLREHTFEIFYWVEFTKPTEYTVTSSKQELSLAGNIATKIQFIRIYIYISRIL